MNDLPEHRRVINGRTWPQTWDTAAFNPIDRYERAFHRLPSWLLAIVCVAACAFIGAALALGSRA